MGLENIKHVSIKYNDKFLPNFSSILESVEYLLKSCIEEKNKLLNKMKSSGNNPPDIKDIVDCMLLCYLCPEIKLQNVNKCMNEYKKIIKNVLKSRNYKLRKIKALSKTLATGNSTCRSQDGVCHAFQSLPRVFLFCKELEKISKKANKPEVDISICTMLWQELSSCGKPADWKILENVFKTNDIYASSLSVWCSKRVKELFNDLSSGIGYFKFLYEVTNAIADGKVGVAEIPDNKENVSKTIEEEDITQSSKSEAMNKEGKISKHSKSRTPNRLSSFNIDKLEQSLPVSKSNESSAENTNKKESKHSKSKISNIFKRLSVSKTSKSETNTTDKEIPASKGNESSTQNADKKTSKNSKSRISNIWKRFSGSKTKTKK